MTQPLHDTVILNALRNLAKTPKQAVHGAGAGKRKLYGQYSMPVSEYLVHEGWAGEVWDARGQLEGLMITKEGMAWLAELERQYREYLARR